MEKEIALMPKVIVQDMGAARMIFRGCTREFQNDTHKEIPNWIMPNLIDCTYRTFPSCMSTSINTIVILSCAIFAKGKNVSVFLQIFEVLDKS